MLDLKGKGGLGSNQVNKRRYLIMLAFLSLLFLFPGCTYLHNPQKATLAKETADEFKKVQDASPKLYTSMQQNLQKTELQASQVHAEVSKLRELNFANEVHHLTWKKIKTDLEAEKIQQDQRKEKIAADVKNLLEKMAVKGPKAADAKEWLEKAKKRLQQAIEAENKWQARQVLFRNSIQFMAKVAASKDKKSVQGLYEEGKKDILGQEITIKVMKDDGQITVEPSTVGKVLTKDLAAVENLNLGEVLRNYTFGNVDPQKAPGLTATILSLGMDLAKTQLNRAELEVNYLGTLIEYLKEELKNSGYVELALNLLTKHLSKENNFVLTDTVLTTLNKMRHQEQATINALRVLSYYGVAVTLERSSREELQTKPAILDHEYSIKLSAINASEHEALISRGLQGLSTYYEGGVKPEMIANLLRAAQSVALAVIGAGVL